MGNCAGLSRFFLLEDFSQKACLYFGGFTTVEVVEYLYFTPAE